MNGVLPIDKPEGPTSHDVVAAARRALGLRRIGHTGTLDPFASGLLLLCLGPSTRLAEYLTGLPKRYEAVARLGVRTDSLDATGEVVKTDDGWAALSVDEIRGAFEAERGTRLQVPPAFSAKRIGGRRAYDLARAGEAVLPDPVEVTIRALDVTAVEGDAVRFHMECSSGTYVRAVAREAGERLGVGAHLTALRRTAIGSFDVEDAISLEDLSERAAVQRALLPPLAALRHLPVVEIGVPEAARVRNGQAVAAPVDRAGIVALASGSELVAIGEAGGGMLRPRKVFA
ncbi:MAG TPA: tRNA pseudouridine(55) synthase TruB [Longimicrobiales bacterium]|nr:tRNA pseudouridine(55) synthase TruB [Longimicrobiales bacterium]